MVLDQLQKDSTDITNLIKKEKQERERDSNIIKERIENERKELQVGFVKIYQTFELQNVLFNQCNLPQLLSRHEQVSYCYCTKTKV